MKYWRGWQDSKQLSLFQTFLSSSLPREVSRGRGVSGHFWIFLISALECGTFSAQVQIYLLANSFPVACPCPSFYCLNTSGNIFPRFLTLATPKISKCQDSEFILTVPTLSPLFFPLAWNLTLVHITKLDLCLFLCTKKSKPNQY